MDSGGRFTEGTNDITLGYARAQRDLACVYSVGFYDDSPEQDEIKNVSVRVRRPGLRAIHPTSYVFRSPRARLVSRLRTAFLSPELYETGVVRAHIFPLRPGSKKVWDSLLAVSFPVALPAHGDEQATREFGALLYRGSKVVHEFNRRVTLRSGAPGRPEEPSVTFLERLALKPGEYRLRVVMADPRGESPHSAAIEMSVPPIPRKQAFMTGPLLGRPAGANIVITSEGDAPEQDRVGGRQSFEPVLVQHFDHPVDLLALTEACLVGGKRREAQQPDAELTRRLRDAAGSGLGTLAAQPLRFVAEDSRVRCESLLDVLPSSGLPAGAYVFEAELRARGAGDTETERVRFSIGPGTMLEQSSPGR